MHRDNMTKVCLVTEELAGIGISGGIGGAFTELALLLARSGAHVDVLYCPIAPLDPAERERAAAELRGHGVGFEILDCGKYAFAPFGPEKRSYSVFKHLEATSGRYDVIHFHDYKGLGFFSMAAKRQGLALRSSQLVVQLHGPTGWVLDANDTLPTHPDQLRIDHLERGSIRHADEVVSPSQYLVDWMRTHGYVFPEHGRVQVIRNVCTALAGRLASRVGQPDAPGAVEPIDEIVLFARHEDRKGFSTFCDALDRVAARLAERGVQVTFLGRFGSIAGRHSGLRLAERARGWRFPVRVLPDLDRDRATDYLAGNPNALVVIPSPQENSPYTVLEAIALGKRILTSDRGGARELVDPAQHDRALCAIDAKSLAAAFERALEQGMPIARLAEPLHDTERKWLAFHDRMLLTARRVVDDADAPPLPRVVLGITHHERPGKLLEAVMSAVRQTYANLEIVVVDDGSPGEETQRALDKIAVVLERAGGRLLRRENGYLGAARNTVAAATESDYLCFLDDDDIAFPDMVEQLVAAASRTGADIVNCVNLYMPESRRAEAWPEPARFQQKVSYVPTGGPLSLAALENCLGSATALIRRDTFEAVGGYTEIHGVGHEDYEFFVRALQRGAHIEISPQPLYLYEVDRPSMIGTTSAIRNTRRVVDAIDFGANSDAWRDLARLRAGQVAEERGANRLRWEMERHPHAQLVQQIVEPSLPLAQRLELLAEYARTIRSPAAAAAFQEAVRRDASSAADGPLEPVIVLAAARDRAAQRRERQHDRSWEIQLDLAIGRQRQAIEQTMRLAGGRPSLSDREWTVVREVARHIDDREALAALLQSLSRLQVAPQQKRKALPTLFEIAAQTEDRPVMEAVFSTTVHADESAYLVRYGDVAKAVAAGTVPDGLTHYRNWGMQEGRKGFEASTEIVEIANGGIVSWDLQGAVFRDVARPSPTVPRGPVAVRLTGTRA